jgi:hypothetical protein
MLHHPIANHTVALALVLAAMAAGCNATGATAIPTTPPANVANSSVPGASGPSVFASTIFGEPFSVTLPAGWKVSDEKPDMFTAYLSTDHTTIDSAIDLQLVTKVHADPCNKDAGDVPGGTTASELASWMLAYKPLAGTAGAETTIAGFPAEVIDEAFAATPCENAELWPTAGGWLDASEKKRYFVFEAGGKRLVATIVSPDAKFASQVDSAMTVIESLRFTP